MASVPHAPDHPSAMECYASLLFLRIHATPDAAPAAMTATAAGPVSPTGAREAVNGWREASGSCHGSARESGKGYCAVRPAMPKFVPGKAIVLGAA